MSEPERYGTCSDANGNWGIEDDGKVILSGLVSHDDCDAVMDILDERDALKAEVERLRFIGDEIIMDVYRSECLTDKWCKMARKWEAAKEGKES